MEIRRSFTIRRFVATLTAGGALLASTAILSPTAQADTGDYSYAFAQLLQGNLLSQLDLATLAAIEGAEAESFGDLDDAPPQTNLDLTLLSAINIPIPGGIQLPLEDVDVGVIGQYARANADGSSEAVVATAGDDGIIGTGDDDAPAPLTLSLDGLLTSLQLPSGILDEVASVDLSFDGVRSTATQAAPGVPSGSYSIDELELTIGSPAVEGVVDALGDVATQAQPLVDGLEAGLEDALDGVVGDLLGGLPLLSIDASVTNLPDLQAVIDSVVVNTLSDAACPGVVIDLSTGSIIVDLDEILALNGRAPNTVIFPDDGTTLNTITDGVTCLLSDLLQTVEDALNAAIGGITIDASVALDLLIDIPLLTINTTLGALLAGDSTGIVLLNGLLGADVNALIADLLAGLTGLTDLTGIIDTLDLDVLDPITSQLLPALDPILSALLRLTVNVQEPTPPSAASLFTERALRVELVPARTDLGALPGVLRLDLANSTVGANVAGAPFLVSLDPDNGPETGGTVVTITGGNLEGATSLTIGGVVIPAANFVFTAGDPAIPDDDTIVFTTPPHAEGLVDVTVTGPTGTSAPLDYTYTPVAPSGLDFTPQQGPTTGGTIVTITGTNLDNTVGVTFDGIPGTNLIQIDDNTVQITTPPHAVGLVDVVVTNDAGSTTADDQFEYLPVTVVIISLDPDEGTELGGTVVTITGTNLGDVDEIIIGGVTIPAANFTYDENDIGDPDDDELVFTTPPHAPGPVQVSVVITNDNLAIPGDLGTSAPLTYTYLAEPANILSLDPDQGPAVGGTSVTITGSQLDTVTLVTIGGVDVTTFTYNANTPAPNDDTITFITPPHIPGVVDVTVTNDGGVSNALPYEYLIGQVIVTSVTPPQGPVAGGNSVTIIGVCFLGASGVTFDGVPATNVVVVNSTTITATVPPGVKGPANVSVIGADFCADGTLPNGYTYIDQTVITDVNPPAGPVAGGNTVTITGVCFTGADQVLFGTTPALSFVVVNDTTITAVVPPGVLGPVSVSVLGADNCVDGTLPNGYTYIDQTIIIDVIPPSGPVGGGNTVTITGVCFTGADQVLFGTTPALSFVVVNDTTITAVVPAGVRGQVSVSVLGADFCNDGTKPNAYTYIGQTVIDTVDPEGGPTSGGNIVTISGTCFTGATQVLFGTTPATSFVVINDTTIEAVAPAHAPGTVAISVLGATNCTDGSKPDAYTFITGDEPEGEPPASTTTNPAPVPDGGAELPGTGGSIGQTVMIALLILAAGIGFSALSRRRRLADATQ